MLAIIWAALMLASVLLILQLVGMRMMVRYFPEGMRWWMEPSQYASIALFGLLCFFAREFF